MGRKTASGGQIERIARATFWVFVAALVIQSAHFLEHVVTIHQFIWFSDPHPLGIGGHIFDFAWVHFVYNSALLLALLWCYTLWLLNPGIWRESRAGSWFFHGLIAVQGYHVVEHTVQMYQYYHYSLQFPPGILGQVVPGLLLHFDFNGVVTLLMVLVVAAFHPTPRPRSPDVVTARWPLSWARADRLPGGAYGAAVFGTGGLSALLLALLVVFAQTAPAAQLVPLASEHCLGQPKAHHETVDAGWSFRDITAASGIEHVVGGSLPPMGRTGLAGTTGFASATESHPMHTLTGGLSAADVDGDGWMDLLLLEHGANRLFRNDGDGTFTDVTALTGFADHEAPSRAALWFDYDNDGRPDLFVANHNVPSRLYRNLGNMTFEDVTVTAGFGRVSSAHGASAVDVDGDGLLDLSVANYGPWQRHGPENQGDARNGERDFLYINQGDGTFVEEGLERGLTATRWTFSHAWHDHDGDGAPDLYVNVDFGFDLLYRNQGDGTFVDVASDIGLVTDKNGMGAYWVDYDNDARFDLFAANIYIACNRDVPQFRGNDLFRANEDGTFTNVARDVGIADGGWGWDSGWFDADHDGWIDGYQANGYSTRGDVDRYHDALVYLSDEAPGQITHRNQGEQPSVAYQKYNETKWVVWSFYPPLSRQAVDQSSQGGYQVDRFWMNRGGSFADASRSVGFTTWSDSRASTLVDLDNDGDLDLVRSAWHRPVQLLENPASARDGANWLLVSLEGTSSNRDAIGALVTVRAGDLQLVRERTASGGFMSQNEPRVHFGLAGHDAVDELVVRWPSGKETRLTDVTANQVLRLVEPA